jgi:hypothetical protein
VKTRVLALSQQKCLQLEVSAMHSNLLIDCLYVLGVYAVFGSISAILRQQQDFGGQTLFSISILTRHDFWLLLKN